MSNIEQNIQYFNNSPIHYMSLGSKELFHTNFWKWLIGVYDKSFAKCFFENIDVSKISKVERELAKMDLTILTSDDKYYVIENKIKSMPDKDQLVGYREKKCNKEFYGVIMGIQEPAFMKDKEVEDWKFLTYKELEARIRTTLKSLNKDQTTIEYKLVNEYCEYISKLQEVLEEFVNLSGNRIVDDKDNIFKIYSQVKLDDLCKKLNAEVFHNYIIKKLQKEFSSSKFKIKSNIGYTNKSALVSFYFDAGDTPNYKGVELGVQIQGKEFKRFLSRLPYDGYLIDTKSLKKQDDAFHYLISKGWFEDFAYTLKDKERYFLGKKTSMAIKYNSYITKEYYMMYQYYNIDNYNFDVLYNAILPELKFVEQILDDVASKF